MKCPRQEAFNVQLSNLLKLATEIGGDHFSQDELGEKIDRLSELKKIFINLWCPILKEYEPFE